MCGIVENKLSRNVWQLYFEFKENHYIPVLRLSSKRCYFHIIFFQDCVKVGFINYSQIE